MVGPSALFMNYIERVLPSLGEDSVTLRAIGGVASDVLGLAAERNDDAAAAIIKGSMRMAPLLQRLVNLPLIDPGPDGVRLRVTVKGEVLGRLNAVCPPHTIFTTNTSTLLPSMYAAATGRPDRFCALHFHLPVWSANVADVMAHPGTSEDTLLAVAAFARRIGQTPIVLRQEHSGYVFNDMFNALNTAAINLVASGVTTIEDVDRAWMGIMKMPVGPGGWLDDIGLDTVWRITDFWAGVTKDPRLRQNAALLKEYVDAGRLGVKSGQGFYSYPNPAYAATGFIEGET